MTNIEMPDGLTYYTADEIAETLSFDDVPDAFNDPDSLYAKLWGFVNDAQNPTPIGGDGSNGTVETPGERYDEDNDDKTPHFWGKLTEVEQTAIASAYLAEYPE